MGSWLSYFADSGNEHQSGEVSQSDLHVYFWESALSCLAYGTAQALQNLWGKADDASSNIGFLLKHIPGCSSNSDLVDTFYF